MADPQKPATATPETPETPVQKAARIKRIQNAVKKSKDEKGLMPSDPKEAKAIAERAADMEVEQIAHEAMEWKRIRGKYPWEEPKNQTQIDNENRLRNSGIDPDKPSELHDRVMETIRRREAEKKTDPGRGRR
jgi:hypothetical protein